MKRLLTSLVVCLSFAEAFAEVPRWRGGTTLYGCEQPYETTSFRRDLANNSYCNPCAPFLVSDDGEYVWSDGPFSFAVTNGTLFVSGERAPIERRKAGTTLREAYLAVVRALFPLSGRVPEADFFEKPQYNTWIESCLTTNNRAMVEGYLAGIVTNRMPCGLLMLDDGWARVPGDLEFDERKFPDARSMFAAIRAKGIRTMVWLTPYVNATSRFYRENVGSPLFYKNAESGKDALFTFYPGLPEAACFDLTKRGNWPALRSRYEAFLARYGIDGFKFDFTDAECLERHKTPQRGYPRDAVPVSATEAWGDFAAANFPFHELRAGWKFGGKPLVVRLQDKGHSWEDLHQVIPDMIAAGLVGCPFVCPDMIGGGCGAGFDKFDRRLFVRSCEVQALMPMMQFSCAPWRVLSADELAVCRAMSELHVRTAPYILACAREAAKTGEPIVRAMEYAFPHQGFALCRQQYMLGEKLLVAPVVSADDSVTVRLPAGRWRDDLGEIHVGPKTLELKGVPLARLPHYSLLSPAAPPAEAETITLRDMDLRTMTVGDGKLAFDTDVYGEKLVVGGKEYAKGLGVHANSTYEFKVVKGAVRSFRAKVGLVNRYTFARQGTVRFRVYGDGRKVAESKVLRYGDGPVDLNADLRGCKTLAVAVDDFDGNTANDIAVWLEADFTVDPGTVFEPLTTEGCEQLGILTPPAPDAPRINPPRVFGVRPGHPILFTLPVSGIRPMRLSARGVPAGATFDGKAGRLSGSVARPGDYEIVFTAENAKGRDERTFRLVVGDKIALTPPMGWNSWNCFASAVTAKDIRDTTDALVASGLRDYGWSYVNIDDFWQNSVSKLKTAEDIQGPFRRNDGTIVVNRRFGDMKALADYVHSRGLKIGLYSSPGPRTCGECAGSWMHEEQDAATYAAWGFDYLKYDLCSYRDFVGAGGLKAHMAPYFLMGRALARQNRDIVYSLCQYGRENSSAWGAKVGGQCWRTTHDIVDTWESMIAIAGQQDGLEHFAGPGGWNDPDMLVVGRVGWAGYGEMHPTRLTHNEQYTHLTLWSIVAAPLLLGCDLAKLDEFTLNLLTNAEVLEVNQDPLGAAGARVKCDGWCSGAWARPLSDGSVAVALLNISSLPRTVRVDFREDLGLVGEWRVRDLWRQRDEGVFKGGYAAALLVHAPKFIRLIPQPGAGLAPGVADCRERAWRRTFDDRNTGGPCSGCK